MDSLALSGAWRWDVFFYFDIAFLHETQWQPHVPHMLFLYIRIDGKKQKAKHFWYVLVSRIVLEQDVECSQAMIL